MTEAVLPPGHVAAPSAPNPARPARVAEALERAGQAGSAAEALEVLASLVRAELRDAMRAAGVAKPEAALNALERTGLDQLLVRGLAFGRISPLAVRCELDRLRRALSERRFTAAELKLALVSLDENAQRLALALDRSAGFRYPTQGNRARDSLLTFARSLHR
jgi:hypothetical protein